MLRRLILRDFVIVATLDLELHAGYTALTGETGAGKSILIDALQLVLGGRGDAGVVREGAARADLTAEFDAPGTLANWLVEGGFDGSLESNDIAPEGTVDPADGPDGRTDDAAERIAGPLLLRRSIDASGKSRAWINGLPATAAQLREAAGHLLDIHGQHAWQSLTRGAAVRALLDGRHSADPAETATAWARWRDAVRVLADADALASDRVRERERLLWQIGELAQLDPSDGEWDSLNAEHRKLSNAQALLDAARTALDAASDADVNAAGLTAVAVAALRPVSGLDAELAEVLGVLAEAQVQLQDAAHTLGSYLHHTEPEPGRLAVLDERLSAWIGLARRHRRPPAELPGMLAQWRTELAALDAAGDAVALADRARAARVAYDTAAARLTAARRATAPRLAADVTAAMQQLGMGGGRLEVAFFPQSEPQSYGMEAVELMVAGHAGSVPRPLAKVASGGELSRIALAIAATTSRSPSGADTATLIFDEIDAGVGGTVGSAVGQLMQRLGATRQVLAVTHLPQVAASADHQLIVTKALRQGADRSEVVGEVVGEVVSEVQQVEGEQRVAEIARMLGGDAHADTGRAHARQLLLAGRRDAGNAGKADKPATAPLRRSA